jgi:hypothetical protein
MPATTLTKVATAAFGEGIADVGYESVDQPNGNDFANTGKEIVLVKNASGGNVVCTVTAAANRETFNKAWTKTLTVAGGDTGQLGPFPTQIFGTAPAIAWDTGTSISAAVVTQTPP